MSKVIVERPRYRSRDKNDYKGQTKAWQKTWNNEDAPVRESSSRGRRPWSSQKELNEHLKPLFRFLLKNVNKSWDKVYSEIRENISPDSAVQMHILQHLDQYVEVNAKEWEDGEITDSSGNKMFEAFYVHPKTKVLCKNESSHYFNRWKAPKREDPFVTVMGRFFKEINTIWYELEMKPFPKEPAYSTKYYLSYVYAHDVALRESISLSKAVSTYGKAIYAASKRQLNKREIRQLGLRK